MYDLSIWQLYQLRIMHSHQDLSILLRFSTLPDRFPQWTRFFIWFAILVITYTLPTTILLEGSPCTLIESYLFGFCILPLNSNI